MTERAREIPPLTRKDFISDQEVRWCPGCGDYAILAAVQKVLPTLGVPREKFVFVSGIGCSSRFPYYVSTYGFHSIHGRAPAIATGIKTANPDLDVWVVTGDGDALSIGGNHFLHAVRRNIALKILLFNNRIYGLTKGQYSPTSEQGKRTRSSPMGSIDYPLHPVCVALAADATFAARTIDTETKHLNMVIERAARHEGTAFVEVFQNCNIFNDGAFDYLKSREWKKDRLIEIEDGKPLLFGSERNRGIRLRNDALETVELGDEVGEKDLVVHREKNPNTHLAYMLAEMDYPEFPVAIGVFRDVRRPTYEEMLEEQLVTARKQEKGTTLEEILRSGETWEVR